MNPTPATISELEQTISTALAGIPVHLSTQAFASASLLTLEPAGSRSPDHQLATGRTSERPQQFALSVSAQGCVLEHLNTGRSFVLKQARCVPSSSAQ